jgi:hypothetical protein
VTVAVWVMQLAEWVAAIYNLQFNIYYF